MNSHEAARRKRALDRRRALANVITRLQPGDMLPSVSELERVFEVSRPGAKKIRRGAIDLAGVRVLLGKHAGKPRYFRG